MSTIKVDKLQGTSGAVTGLTFSGANGTFGGTLASYRCSYCRY